MFEVLIVCRYILSMDMKTLVSCQILIIKWSVGLVYGVQRHNILVISWRSVLNG